MGWRLRWSECRFSSYFSLLNKNLNTPNFTTIFKTSSTHISEFPTFTIIKSVNTTYCWDVPYRWTRVCGIYRLSSLLRSLGSVSVSVQSQRSLCEQLPRAVIFLIIKMRRGFSQLSLCMHYFPSIYFFSLISVSCHHLNSPLTITLIFILTPLSETYT